MSESEITTTDESGLTGDLKEVYRSVTPNVGMHGNTEMSLLGLIWFGLLLVILIPLAPFIALVWAIGYVRERLLSEEEVNVHVHDQIRARERVRKGRVG